MFDRFGDYMFYLLNAPLKKLRGGTNQLKLFFGVTGGIFDGMLQDILKFRRQRMISTADDIMLEVMGRDRDMYRFQGETLGQYRHRLQMKAVIAELGGTNKGLLLAMEVLGYPDCVVKPLYETDRGRWAEIYVDILVVHDINYDAIVYEVLKVKTARTLPHFRLQRKERAKGIKSVAVMGIGNIIKVKARVAGRISAVSEDGPVSVLFMCETVSVKANDRIGDKDIYVLSGAGQKTRVLTGAGSVIRTG